MCLRARLLLTRTWEQYDSTACTLTLQPPPLPSAAAPPPSCAVSSPSTAATSAPRRSGKRTDSRPSSHRTAGAATLRNALISASAPVFALLRGGARLPRSVSLPCASTLLQISVAAREGRRLAFNA